MAWGRRCEIGCETWPDESTYTTCPSCGEKTTRYSNLSPLDAAEARSLRVHGATTSAGAPASGSPLRVPFPSARVLSFPLRAALAAEAAAALRLLPYRLLRGAVLDMLLGPAEDFDYVSVTTASPPSPPRS
jgi:hypothetical protein